MGGGRKELFERREGERKRLVQREPELVIFRPKRNGRWVGN